MKAAFSLAEFIAMHGLDSELYHELLANGIAPKTYHIKDREFITQESASSWRRKMERLAAEPRHE